LGLWKHKPYDIILALKAMKKRVVDQLILRERAFAVSPYEVIYEVHF